MKMDFVMGQLRHLYSLMLAGHVKDTAEAARGLLGPSIAALEQGPTTSDDVERAATLAWNEAVEKAAQEAQEFGVFTEDERLLRNTIASAIRTLKRTT